jgi:hypothetical protein
MAENTEVSKAGPKYGLLDVVKGKAPTTTKSPDQMVFTWPDLVAIEFLAALAMMIILMVLAFASPAPLEEMASQSTTPNPMKAPWYFLGLQELLVYFDPWIAGVVLPVMIIVGLMMIPYLDNNPLGKGYYSYSQRKFAVWSFAFGSALWYITIIIGVYTRGLDWQWYWPWDDWTLHKSVATVKLVDLEILLAEKFGITQETGNVITYFITLGYYVVGMIVPVFLFKKFVKSLGWLRYALLSFMYVTMLGVPLKIFVRLVMNVKYVLITPYFKI